MIGADVEAIFVWVAGAFDLGLEVVAAWRGDGCVGGGVGGRVGDGGCVDWVGWCGKGESGG